ncbi:double-strand break repair helicase AddA [Roseovarius sp. A46]|uniref:double-strand break repair helicase AddA n=1 Tax=Roseovarius sp. A46 TaxID=2109331 RepID=UPI001013386D|nr:double-strand break repair helicase AddA [Roseovarius sp. A46]RXV66958.1 double-strand break repair helicase AddA [Roseovarius sp. A46]
MTTLHPASLAQIIAARPDRSTWLSANAGSGKTRVLTNRVARLLLDGVNPQHILCLTYTKAAASEMQIRLFDTLGTWAMMPDGALAAALGDLGHDGETGPDMLRRARRLFAQAIETPGGLRIQTIHAFCASLLRRFPLEAGVTPDFAEIDDQTARLLRAEIVEEIAAGPEAPVLSALARHHADESLDALARDILARQADFTTAPDDAALCALLDQPGDLSRDSIAARVFLGSEGALLDQLLPVLRASSSNDVKAAEKLATLTALDFSALPVLESVFLLQSGENAFAPKLPGITRQPFPTNPIRKAQPELMAELDAWMTRVSEAREARLALLTIERTRALHDFAQVFIRLYSGVKQRRGLLDFDDLILRARDLLTDSSVAAWVLYRLDGGIDHILVDEAQDTSPVQWQVIERLAQEFTSGAGARADVRRTLFVVGDRKQSIYSFQGADAREFDRMRQEFGLRLDATGTPLQERRLDYSFRSSQAILRAVDTCLSGAEESGFAPDQSHIAFFDTLPGRVDLWPPVAKPESAEPPPWHHPVDIPAETDPAVILARHIADHIRALLDARTAIPDRDAEGGARLMRAGDVLILVRSRSRLFHEIIRACKSADLPVAGADRLKVGGELAVRDLAALLSFLATGDDDLALATALRSPLFGFTEAQLFDLAAHRGRRTLWEALHAARAAHPETLAILDDLRDHADFLRPYDLIERMLTRHEGRRRLLARLGPEAEDGIDALLAQAMTYEGRAVSSLTGFLVWMETDEMEIKRQMDSAGDRIRVMTVHGAKGLEAPVVILPQAGKWNAPTAPAIVIHEGTPFWRGNKDEMPGALATAAETGQAAQLAERDRLLYVAMTRAEKWLIVAAAGDLGSDGAAWHDRIREGLATAGARPHAFPTGDGLRLEAGAWPETGTDTAQLAPGTETILDPLFAAHAPAHDTAPKTLKPSDLGGATTLPGEGGLDEPAAKRRGRQVHRLLEILPPLPTADRPAAAHTLLCHGPDAASEEEIALLLAEAEKVLSRPSLAHLFTADALAEVPFSAALDALGGRRIHGVIDRLILAPDRVLAVDFKTNAVLPDRPEDTPEGLLRQMGAYAHALAAIYPDREVETALLWTRTATLMPLPHALVTAALLRAGSLDAGGGAT